MTARRTSRGRNSGRGAKRRYHWFGNQFPVTTVAAATSRTLVELVSGAQLERLGGGTLVGIRGWLNFQNNAANADLGDVFAAGKIMYLRVDDAQTVDDDIQPIDNHEEDIAMRQLWTWVGNFEARASDTILMRTQSLELNVRSKVVLRGGGKFSVWLILQTEAGAGSRLTTTGYLRACVKY